MRQLLVNFDVASVMVKLAANIAGEVSRSELSFDVLLHVKSNLRLGKKLLAACVAFEFKIPRVSRILVHEHRTCFQLLSAKLAGHELASRGCFRFRIVFLPYVSFQHLQRREKVVADTALESVDVSNQKMFVQTFLAVGFERTAVALELRLFDAPD